MADSFRSNSTRLSLAMERTGQWIFSQEIPTDVIVEVGEANFPLHKFMLLAKSNYIRKLILDSKEPDLATINLSDIPGGPEMFEKAAKFCYGVNFEITVHNVAALRCAAEYLEMTDKYCDNNLASRTDDFLSQVALTSLSGAVEVLKSCEDLLPLAEDLKIVQRCVAIASSKACNEANNPSRSPPNWWTDELSILDIPFFEQIISAMKSRGAKALTIATAITTYAERSLIWDHSDNYNDDSDVIIQQRNLLQSIVSLLLSDNYKSTGFQIHFLCSLLRLAIFLKSPNTTKTDLEKRISAILEHVTVDDLLVVSFAYETDQRLFDLESVRRIISGFVEREKNVAVFDAGSDDFMEVCSTAMQRVAKNVDAYLGAIATCDGLSISKFNGIASLVPNGAREVDDDLYRAIDIYLKAHPTLDEIEREKVCSVMDPLKLSYEARVHASQNKRLPVQIVLHALYYDQLKLRSTNQNDHNTPDSTTTRNQVQADVSLIKENESLRSEMMKMKVIISDMQKNQGTSSKGGYRRKQFFTSMSKTLGRLNPFKNGSKDTLNIEDDVVDVSKPRRRRFSIS